MKKFTNLCLIMLIALATVFCITACSGNGKTVNYEITVNTKNVSVDTNKIKVCVYSLDGKVVKEANLTSGKAKFELQADSYVATLSGLDEKVSFSSVLLTKNSRKATIALGNSDYDEFEDSYSYAFTVIVLNGDYKLSDLSAQICDLDMTCIMEYFDKSNVVDGTTNGGECSVEIFDKDNQEIYNETFTVHLDRRFHIVQL